MGIIDYAVIGVYFVVLVWVGVYGSKKTASTEDYLVAGRRLNVWMYMACLSAVILGGASTVGTVKLGYQFGISGIWLVVMLGLGTLFLGWFLSKRIARLRIVSISELLEQRFHHHSRLISAAIMVIYTSMVTVTQVIGIGTVLSAILGWDLHLSMIIGGSIVLFYTMKGGMWSVSLTDSIQFVIMTVGIFFILLPLGWSKAGGFSGLSNRLEGSYFDVTAIGWDTIFSFFLLYFLGMMIGQDIWQRLFTAKNENVAKNGTILAGVYSILFAVACTLIGMTAAVLLPGLEDPQLAFPKLATAILPPGVLGIVLAAVISALMSTASGTLLASSTLLVHDIWKRFFRPDLTDQQFLQATRWTTVILGVFILTMAVWIQDVIVALDVAYAFLSGSIFVPVMAAFFWKRATSQGVWLSILVSGAVVLATLILKGITSTDPIIYGIVSSLIILVATSLLGAKPQPAEQGKKSEAI
ncbi:3-guanidinopropionate transporter [Marinithermofilum abyssi]|uniref:3-guanidinopropionate transporter n=1 Tax=Marinithermofilum abyssi TaxID=1571185 RepID=A0A8J2YAN6_9BACL|nr:sodium:solute symporter [Marinithermofilum abyssi]GGE17054.1 3-guanidinopropionate transporter [Marinithermofilum abyssi]